MSSFKNQQFYSSINEQFPLIKEHTVYVESSAARDNLVTSNFKSSEKFYDYESVIIAKGNYRRVGFYAVVCLCAFLVSLTLLLRANVEERSSGNTMSIQYDSLSKQYKIIDNAPIFSEVVSSPSVEKVLAYGTYQRNINGNGWNYLTIAATDVNNYVNAKHMKKKNFKEMIGQQYFRTMEAIGFMEGYLTCHEMNQFYINFYSGLFDGGDPTTDALEFLEANHDWMIEKAEKHWREDDYWLAVKGIIAQLDGMLAGAMEGCPYTESHATEEEKGVYLPDLVRRPSMIHMLLLNSNGDLYQIADKFLQMNAPPSDILEDIPNDDDYYLPYTHHKNKTANATQQHPETAEEVSGRLDTETHRFQERAVAEERRDSESTDAEQLNSMLRRAAARDRVTERTAVNPVKPAPSVETTASRFWDRAAHKASESYKRLRDGSNPRPRGHRKLDERLDKPQLPRSRRADHCSALIKILPDRSDILFGHNTWDDFQLAAPRIFKHYSYNLFVDAMPLKQATPFDIHFSSSPGIISSVDDFFVIKGSHGANLAVIETTNDMNNRTLLELITPHSLLSWARARISHQLAYDGQSWADAFSRYQSGTYVNQWMVVDFSRFTPFQDPQPGFLTILEEVPGYVHVADVTDVLNRQRYWASYNNPYFDDISRLSMDSQYCEVDPNECHDTDPRAMIFRARQGGVQGMQDMQRLMEYNDWQHDPLSLNNSCNAIACRADVNPHDNSSYPFGAIDAKVTSVMLASRDSPTILARLGPTYDQQPVFCWDIWDVLRNKRNKRFHHIGHPDCFQFNWQVFPPANLYGHI